MIAALLVFTGVAFAGDGNNGNHNGWNNPNNPHYDGSHDNGNHNGWNNPNNPHYDGTPGPQGPPGQDGEDGKDGKDGVDGKDGKDGIDGKDGEDGMTGPAGPAGKDGMSLDERRIGEAAALGMLKPMLDPGSDAFQIGLDASSYFDSTTHTVYEAIGVSAGTQFNDRVFFHMTAAGVPDTGTVAATIGVTFKFK